MLKRPCVSAFILQKIVDPWEEARMSDGPSANYPLPDSDIQAAYASSWNTHQTYVRVKFLPNDPSKRMIYRLQPVRE